MTYGKNQRALLTFLEKHPDRWHRIKRRKAINAARGLHDRSIGVTATWRWHKEFIVRYSTPQMLRRQA